MSSLSSVLMTSCLKENVAIEAGFGASGAFSGRCVGAAASPSSVGRTFLTTRRTTFTTFFRVRPWSSAVSVWLVLVPGILPLAAAVPLAMLLPVRPFCSLPLFITGSGLKAARGGSGLLNRPVSLDGGSGLLKRSGTLTGDLTLGGEGLLTRPTDSVVCGDSGLLARNNPLPGSRAGTDLAWLDSPLLSGYS